MRVSSHYPPLEILYKFLDPKNTKPEDVKKILKQEPYIKTIALKEKVIDDVVVEIMGKLQTIANENEKK